MKTEEMTLPKCLSMLRVGDVMFQKSDANIGYFICPITHYLYMKHTSPEALPVLAKLRIDGSSDWLIKERSDWSHSCSLTKGGEN